MTDRSVAQSESVVLNKDAVFNATRAVEEMKEFIKIDQNQEFIAKVKEIVQIHLAHKVSSILSILFCEVVFKNIEALKWFLGDTRQFKGWRSPNNSIPIPMRDAQKWKIASGTLPFPGILAVFRPR